MKSVLKCNKLTGLYGQLKTDERFRLHLQALARDDNNEAVRLRETCPIETYRSWEQGFRDATRTSMMLVYALSADMNLHLGMVQVIEDMQAKLRAAKTQMPNAKSSTSKAVLTIVNNLYQIYETWRVELNQLLKTMWIAFDRFCKDRMQMDGRTVIMAWVPQLAGEMDDRASLMVDIAVDENEISTVVEILEHTWAKGTSQAS